ncbi:hypothetical protein J6O86_02990 [bacterium]|nr:hypothetical protein [bacterium]
MTRQDYSKAISYQDISLLQAGYIEVFHSEYRDENVKGKYYAFLRTWDSSGNDDDFWTSDDFDTPEEAINDLKNDINTKFRKFIQKDIDVIK